MSKIFDKHKLREDIIKTWGEHGAHALIFDELVEDLEMSYTPNKYDPKSVDLEVGKYMVQRKDGKIHFERYNGTGFAYNDSSIVTYYLPKISL